MQFFGFMSRLALASLFVTMAACALERTADQPSKQTESDSLESSNTEVQSATLEDMVAQAASSSGGSITPNTGCSVVNFCNASGSDGTVCQQTGCSLLQAQNQCRDDVRNICGAANCPFIFITSSGQRITITCSINKCSSGNAISCGGKCCPTSAIACSSGGVCLSP